MRRFPVTNREYIAFLDALVARGEEETALRLAPRNQAEIATDDGAILYGRDAAGRFVLRADSEGDVWLPDWPVVMVHFGCAVAYARWLAGTTGRAWRLPAELEWEKAARGTDGRFFPWGMHLDPSWCCMRQSREDRLLPSVVDDFPVDESVYAVRGMGGNVREQCGDRYVKEGPTGDRVLAPCLPVGADPSATVSQGARGGYFHGPPGAVRCANRSPAVQALRHAYIGFRLARSYPP
jgi:serine/threonine-protein kinase